MNREEMFRRFSREQTLRAFRILMVAVALGCLLWWPLDQFSFTNNPDAREAFSHLRSSIILQAPFWYVVATLMRGRRWPIWPLLFGTGAAMLAVVGYDIGRAGDLVHPWIYTQYVVPQLTMPLYAPFAFRVLLTLWLPATTLTGFFVATGNDVSSPEAIYFISFMLFCVCVSLATGHIMYHQARQIFFQRLEIAERERVLEVRVQEQTQALMTLANRLQDAREEERQQIAVDLHDGLGQFISGLRLSLDWLRRSDGQYGVVSRYYGQTSNLLERLSAVIREIVQQLRPEALERLGLAAAVDALVAHHVQHLGILINVTGRDNLDAIDARKSLSVYRIIQEAMNNVAKHARATRVDIGCELDSGRCIVTIRDNGRGVGQEVRMKDGHYGVISMRERAAAIGGRITLENASGQPGTIVTLVMDG